MQVAADEAPIEVSGTASPGTAACRVHEWHESRPKSRSNHDTDLPMIEA